MAERARGAISDRPWGRTLYTLAQRAFTGQITVTGDGGRPHAIAFVDGAVTNASSPLAIDSAIRVAMTNGLLSTTQVADVVRRQAADPSRDEVDVVAAQARLVPEQAMRLRRWIAAQRAARTFSLDRGQFVLDDRATLAHVPGCEIDIRAVIHYGARQNFSDERLDQELAMFGSFYRLRPDALADLSQYGFSGDPSERVVLERMRSGAALSELEALGSDSRGVRAVVYALVACNACEVDGPVPRAPRNSAPPVNTESVDAPTIRKLDIPHNAGHAVDAQTVHKSRAAEGSRTPETKSRTQATTETRALISDRARLIKDHADHYALLGVKFDATEEQIRKAYFDVARKLHPDRLAALGIVDDSREAHRVFAQINTAFGVLSDPVRRTEYTQILRRGGEAAVREEQARAEELAARILAAEEAFRLGEQLLRRDQLVTAIDELARAVQLNPDEPDYFATHAWARFCAAPDKAAAAPATRNSLERAIAKSPRAITARFLLGRVERMLGRDADALRHFQLVLQLDPQHREAAAEARALEQRVRR